MYRPVRSSRTSDPAPRAVVPVGGGTTSAASSGCRWGSAVDVRLSERCKSALLRALASLQRAAHADYCRVCNDDGLEVKHKTYFLTKFSAVVHDVGTYIARVTGDGDGGDGPGSRTDVGFYASLYRLEARYSVYCKRYTAVKVGSKKEHGFFRDLLKFLLCYSR